MLIFQPSVSGEPPPNMSPSALCPQVCPCSWFVVNRNSASAVLFCGIIVHVCKSLIGERTNPRENQRINDGLSDYKEICFCFLLQF
jgi:hypothetical protein